MALTQRFFTDAFRDMDRTFALLDDPDFLDKARRSLSSASNAVQTRHPPTDLIETESDFELHCELPGYDKKDIHIEMTDDNTIVISGDVQKEKQTSLEDAKKKKKKTNKNEQETTNKTPKWWKNERVHRSFQRTFSLPSPVKSDGITATYENGVLKVIVPKQGRETKRIRIE